jgi:hypothetical protein
MNWKGGDVGIRIPRPKGLESDSSLILHPSSVICSTLPQCGRPRTTRCRPRTGGSCLAAGHKSYNRRSRPRGRAAPRKQDDSTPRAPGFPGKNCRPPAPPTDQDVSSSWIRRATDKRSQWLGPTPGLYNRRRIAGSRRRCLSTRLQPSESSVTNSTALQPLELARRASEGISFPLRLCVRLTAKC